MTTRHTTANLHRLMGEILTRATEVPALAPLLTAEWILAVGGYRDGLTANTYSVYAVDGTLLDAARTEWGPGHTERVATSTTYADGTQSRMHTLHTTYASVPLRISAHLPEPTEREELLARLAELDAASDA
ncbi:hypothetical protein [Streptomyces sp. ST2-7A]|uniref:hypothetical protein n=1 Tax=Streptomyces sp. ST2-7A TaxID=2907214 RepID=UPI001F1C71E4|nr:hypothetical protein [Streptomyces sp. ST2-7A]MCE7083471.1 hypothetical protein [Streptomyces sp. ST2-7A]